MALSDILTYGRNFLKGKFTYTVAWISIVWAVFGALLGYIDTGTATTIISTSALAVGIRRNMVNKGNVGRPTGT